MNEVLEIEVDGELDDGADRRGPTWGLPAAIAVVGVLTLIVVLRIVVPGLTGHHGQKAARPPAPTTPTQITKQPPSEAPPADPRVESARAALAAWGRFAGSGDPSILTGLFAPDGPEYRLLATEVSEDAAGPRSDRPYTVTLPEARLLAATTNQAVISATAMWARPDEPGQTFRWEIVLRPDQAGHWLVWTLRDQQAGSR